MLELAAIFVSFTALFAYLNYRFVGLPGLEERVEDVMSRVDFNRLLMDGMLSFILFCRCPAC